MIVVTGWPRSGTSLLMRMLVSGGLEPIHLNGARPAPHNPGGLWEHPLALTDPIRLVLPSRDPNRCLKVLYRPLRRLLEHPGAVAGIVRTDRAPEAAAASRTAVQREGMPPVDPSELEATRARTLELVAAAGVPVHVVPFGPLAADPAPHAAELAAFVQPLVTVALNVDAMAAVPDPSLIHFT